MTKLITKSYFVYLLQCADSTFYSGYTTNLDRRLNQHNSSAKGAKYTSGRRPVVLKYFEKHQNLSSALKREHQLKKLTHQEKSNLAKTGTSS